MSVTSSRHTHRKGIRWISVTIFWDTMWILSLLKSRPSEWPWKCLFLEVDFSCRRYSPKKNVFGFCKELNVSWKHQWDADRNYSLECQILWYIQIYVWYIWWFYPKVVNVLSDCHILRTSIRETCWNILLDIATGLMLNMGCGVYSIALSHVCLSF